MTIMSLNLIFYIMAKVQNTLIGRSSGSVGGATFTTWKGINVLKSKAIAVANPQTIAQMLQRQKLTLMVAFYRAISIMVQIGFSPQAIGKSEYNAFMSQNLNNATSGTEASNAAIVPSLLKMSKGTMGVTPFGNAAPTTGNTWRTQYITDIPLGGSANDIAYSVAWNQTQNTFAWSDGTALRSDAAVDVTFDDAQVTGDIINFYLFFKSATSNEVSDSTFLPKTVA